MRSKRKKSFKCNQRHLPLKRVIPTEEQAAHIRFFDVDCEEVTVHTDYTRCPGAGCAACAKGNRPFLVYLLPVLDLRAKRVSVLLIPSSDAPRSLNDLVDTIYSHSEYEKMDFIIGKESKMSFNVEQAPNLLSDYGWVPAAIKRFNEQTNKTELILAALRYAPRSDDSGSTPLNLEPLDLGFGT